MPVTYSVFKNDVGTRSQLKDPHSMSKQELAGIVTNLQAQLWLRTCESGSGLDALVVITEGALAGADLADALYQVLDSHGLNPITADEPVPRKVPRKGSRK